MDAENYILKRTYEIQTLHSDVRPDTIDWDRIPAAPIITYKWSDNDYAPIAKAQMVLLPHDGFVLRMSCLEKDPRAEWEHYNDPVYEDSCLEFFAAWAYGCHEEGQPIDTRYMNLEMNARGAHLACLGSSREGRLPIRIFSREAYPEVTAETTPDGWSVTACIPTGFLCAMYGLPSSTFKSGYRFRGNFYKCGDKTEQPHYGMWNNIESEEPDFHRPEYFGELVIR